MVPGRRIRQILSLRRFRSNAARTAAWEARFHASVRALQEGHLDPAERESAAALDEAELFSEDDPRLGVSLSHLAGIYRMRGKWDEAEPLCRRALELKEARLGTAHPDVASTLKDLVEICRAQGKTAEADRLYERALAILEKAIGPDFAELSESLDRSRLLGKRRED